MTNLDIKNDTLLVSHMFYTEDIFEIFIVDHIAEISMDEIGNEKSLVKIKEYIEKHFSVNDTNSEKLASAFVNSKTDETTITLFYKYKIDDQKKELYVKNTFLIEYFGQQKNLMVVKTANQEKGYIFNKDNSTQVVIIN